MKDGETSHGNDRQYFEIYSEVQSLLPFLWYGEDLVIQLSGGNDDNAVNLQRCVGECDNDAQCAPGLVCFQRSDGYETIPGCKGNGNHNWDYCYDPSIFPILCD